MGQRDGQRPAFGHAERAGFLADEDDGRLAADGQRRTGRLDRLQGGDLLAGTHPGQHGGRNGGDMPDDGGGRLRFARGRPSWPAGLAAAGLTCRPHDRDGCSPPGPSFFRVQGTGPAARRARPTNTDRTYELFMSRLAERSGLSVIWAAARNATIASVDDRGGSPGQVMTRALDKLEVSIRQGPSQAAGGFEGNHGVLGVGEHQNRPRTDAMARSSSSSSRSRARCSVRNVRQSGWRPWPAWPQTCQLTFSAGRSVRSRRRAILASRPRAIHGVSRNVTCAHSRPAPGAASSLSQPVTYPGPTLASRTTAATRPGSRLAADSATPPPKECPTSTARAIPCESRSSSTARAFMASPPAGSRLEP